MLNIYNKKFPTPKFLSMASFAIDISDQSIKYGKLFRTNSGLHLKNYGKMEIGPNIVNSGKIENPNELVNALKKIKDKEKMDFIRVALPEEQIYLFTLSLPKMNWKELKESILLQLEEHIPIQASNTVFDFEVLEEVGSSLIVQVVATPVDLIESYMSVFEQAGLTPISFELEAQAIARCVVKRDSEETLMIVDFGGTRTGISIISNRQVLFTATVDVGGNMLTEMIMKCFGISNKEAENIKKLYNISSHEEGNKIFASILNGISVLHDEINKHMSFWSTHDDDNGKKRKPIERIIMCGGDANLKGVADYLEVSLKIPVTHANAWVNILDLDHEIPEMGLGESLGFVTVLGLALNDFLEE